MRDRTADLLRARQALSQLSYSPNKFCQQPRSLPSKPNRFRSRRECATHSLLRERCRNEELGDLVGLGRFELPTSPLSGVRSNQLSYRPAVHPKQESRLAASYRAQSASQHRDSVRINRTNEDKCVSTHQVVPTSFKEVIQPQVPLGLPCYDFTPVMNHSVVIALPKVRLTTSGATHSHGVTGGVYKARERIHRGILIRDY